MTSVSVKAQISMRRYQSLLERAKRDDSKHNTAPPGRRGPRAALVLVNDDNEVVSPSELTGPGGEVVLARRARGVGTDLHKRGLADVDQGRTGQVGIAELGIGEWCEHRLSPYEDSRTAS